MSTEHVQAAPPSAAKRPVTRTHHGIDFVDDYEWLRDKESPDTLAYLEAENAHTAAATDHLAALRDRVFDEVKSRVQETDLSVPVRMGDWWYFTRTAEGSQYGVHCRAPIAGPDDWTPPSSWSPWQVPPLYPAALLPPRPAGPHQSRPFHLFPHVNRTP